MKGIVKMAAEWLKTENHGVELGWSAEEECCRILLYHENGEIFADSGECYPPKLEENEVLALLKRFRCNLNLIEM